MSDPMDHPRFHEFYGNHMSRGCTESQAETRAIADVHELLQNEELAKAHYERGIQNAYMSLVKESIRKLKDKDCADEEKQAHFDKFQNAIDHLETVFSEQLEVLMQDKTESQ